MSQSVTVIFGAGACGLLREPQSTLPPVRQRWPVPADTECGDALCRPRLARHDAELAKRGHSGLGRILKTRHLARLDSAAAPSAVRPVDYAVYAAAAAALAVRVRPHVLYASDPLAALPARLASKLSGAPIVYHEHDSPDPGALRPWIARRRAEVMRAARLIIFPNEVRARIARDELGFPSDRLRIAWNVPRRAELPVLEASSEEPLLLYYHGNISPKRVPEGIVEAVRRLDGRVRLRVTGYEAPSARGYVGDFLISVAVPTMSRW